MSGLVRKLFSEDDLLELFENELMHSKNRKRSLFEEDDMQEDEDEGDSEKEVSSIEDTIEELDLESMDDMQKIELAKEILSSCEEIDCKDIMDDLNKLMNGSNSSNKEESEEEEEDEEEED